MDDGDVRRYLDGLDAPPWGGDRPEVSFLARGEYSLNYRAGAYVVRLVTGSQIGLSLQDQAPYEHHALELLAPSGSTPTPVLVDTDPPGLDWPVIIEEFLPGRPLQYATDLVAAARCVATIHRLGVPEHHRLQSRPDPAPAILAESRELAAPYLDWPDAPAATRQALRAAFDVVEHLPTRDGLVTEGDLAIVNYDLNTHNFVVTEQRAKLLDWEKARIAPLTQDLAHFLLPTTTLWRDDTATRLTQGQEQQFIDAYLAEHPQPDHDRFLAQLAAMRIMISLRAVSWCAWALQQTARHGRTIVNEETLRTSRRYLEPAFLHSLFG